MKLFPGIATPEYPRQETGDRRPETVKTPPDLFAPELLSPAPPPVLDAVQQRVYDQLASRRHADELTRELGLPVNELSRVLMHLEMKRLVRRLPGNFYERR